jgi:DNA-binding transcriptional ArsR family regulator
MMQPEREAARLRREGFDPDVIDMAEQVQQAQRRNGQPVQSLRDICNGVKPPKGRARGAEVVPLSDRQHRKRGVVGQLALDAFRVSEVEQDPEKRELLKRVAAQLREATGQPAPSEYAFFDGNFSMSDRFVDLAFERLAGAPHENEALRVLLGLTRFVGRSDPEVHYGRQADLAAYVRMKQPNVARALKTLEELRIIKRVKDGKRSRVFFDPEGVYRGSMEKQAETRQKYANVVQLHPGE